MKTGHLILGVYIQDEIAACWGNLEQGDLILDGVISIVRPLAKVLDQDVKIIRPRQLSIFTNDKALVEKFTRPITTLDMQYLIPLFRIDKWKFYYAADDKLPKARELWTQYNKPE